MTAPREHSPSPDDVAKPFLEHVEDLRWMLVRCAGAWIVGLCVCLFYTHEILALLMQPLRQAGEDPEKFLIVLGVIDPFTVHFNIGMFGGFILALPAVLYFMAQFLLPALTPAEKQFMRPVFLAGTGLFGAGLVFCYTLILPETLRFFLSYNQYMGFRPQWTITNYLDFTLQLLLGFSLSFELPLVILLLNHFGLVSSEFLAAQRRYAFLAIFIMATCIVPSTDLFSIMLLAGPLYTLYEGCIWLTWWRERKAGVGALAKERAGS